ncbi:MAG: hypothetical protein H7Z10_08820, partial [Gemmatimonadaceae bacterium]|nr:hypothetical protein [Acetobacteraceae bacterium]
MFRRLLGRAFTLLAAVVGLGACVVDPGSAGYNRPVPVGGAVVAQSAAVLPGRRVAILLPLTGANA